ncbi:hypothetical protein BDV98DRAFT_658604 [Pterulicium gracile]|uniref:Uncharacterized protein n=1 Tax=Pterulicium gracile TaxID=1884261 RepID=A0A5C3Q5X9_9AGAR|nr:hypothetical protein BDV98DRAFT_658604 [Pterula gracilis]
MPRLSSSSLFTLAILMARVFVPTAASPLPPTDILLDEVAYISADAGGELVGYRVDGSLVGRLPHESALQTRQSSGCKLMSVDEAKSLDGWGDIEKYAHDNWGKKKYNLANDFEGRSALVCVDQEPAVLNADATPSCTNRESSTGGTLVGTSGQVTISYTQGYSQSAAMTVTESTSLGSSLTANVGFKLLDLLDVGASVTTTATVTNTVSESFTVTETSQDTQSVTMQAAEGKTCQLRFTNKTCSVQGSGTVKYVASGWIWFNYVDKTKGHYKWGVNIGAVVPDVNRRSATASVRGVVSGESKSEYQGSCE